MTRAAEVGHEVLAGRDDELAMIEGALAAGRARAGAALMFEGAAGLGKTSLLDVAARRAIASGMRVVRTKGLASERDVPFGLVHQLAGPLIATALRPAGTALLDGVTASVAGALAHGSPADVPAAMHGLYWLVANASVHRALLVCVDDADLADEPSLRFVSYLTHRLDGLGVTLLLAARPAGPMQDPGIAAIRAAMADCRRSLAPLSVGQIATVVEGCVPRPSDGFASACADVTGGNPYYVQEVLRAIRSGDLDASSTDATRLLDIGAAAVHRASLIRMARAGADAVRLAQALAVLVDGAPLRRAAVLADLEPAAAARAADVLAAEGLVTVADGRIGFVHQLLRQSVYEDLLQCHRSIQHGRTAHILAAEGAAEELITTHLLRALPDGDRWAVDLLRSAAARAQAVGAPEAAVRYLRRALEEPPTPAIRPQLLLDLGRAEAATCHPDAVMHLAAAMQSLGDAGLKAEARRSMAEALASTGRRREAATVLQALLDETPAGTDAHEAAMADLLATAMFEPGLRQRALARVDALDLVRPPGRSAAERRRLAMLAVRSGQRAAPADVTASLVLDAWQDGQLLRDNGPADPAWHLVVWATQLAERFEITVQITTTVIAAAQQAGNVDAAATAAYFRAVAQRQRGLLLDAQDDLERALGAESSGWHRFSAACRAHLADVLVERGRLDDARTVLAELGRDEPADGPGGAVATGTLESAYLLHARGMLALAEHRGGQALALLQRAGAGLSGGLNAERTLLPWRTDAALAALACGRTDLVADLIAPLHARATRAGLPLSLSRVLRVRGLVAARAGEHDLLWHAADVAEAAGNTLRCAEALVDAGAALRRCGRLQDSRAPLRRALDLAAKCGAEPVARRAAEELAAAGCRPPRTAAIGAAALTPSELRVARMAASGLTNRQIAQALFVTIKTVEYHLRHSFEKLRVTRRSDLAAHLDPAPAGRASPA